MQLETIHTEIEHKVARRRTFAIISHPDAGKTTLTEKLLLYSGAIQLAGNVRARKTQRSTVSDWMEIEKTRGISISSSVVQFAHSGHVINLLDTPGHDDFSEDTYRTLSAVDSAVMVLDAAKGIEGQTKKLFEVCRLRGIPILTFINKMDRPAKPPLSLLDEIQDVLGLDPVPVTWPIGDGINFQGVYNREQDEVILFERTTRNETKAGEQIVALEQFIEQSEKAVNSELLDAFLSEIRMLDGLGIEVSKSKVLNQEQTPVFFGSALSSFGVGLFLSEFLSLSPPPQPYQMESGEVVSPSDPDFSGFVFKIQANLDPRHRDSVAFLRICSGKFERGMSVIHEPSQREFRLQTVYKTFAQDREIIEDAYPGDIIAIPNNGNFKISDSFYSGRNARFKQIPRFSPESFAVIQNSDVTKHKQFDKGLEQLANEGAILVLYKVHSSKREPILAAVGNLQFEVVQARLKNEYGVETQLTHADFAFARWVIDQGGTDLKSVSQNNVVVTEDDSGNYVVLFGSKFSEDLFKERQADVTLASVSSI